MYTFPHVADGDVKMTRCCTGSRCRTGGGVELVWFRTRTALFSGSASQKFLPRKQLCSVLGVVILSVHHTRALWQSQTMHCGYFATTRKCNHSAIPKPTVVGGRRPLQSEICAESDSPHLEKRRLGQVSAYNVSTVRDSEQVQLWRIGSGPWAFQRTIAGVRTLPLSSWWLKVKRRFFVY